MFLEMDKGELANLFVDNILATNRGFNYYVDWNNVRDVDKYRTEFEAMNRLIRSNNIRRDFSELVRRLPSVIETFPFLFGLSRAERNIVINRGGLLKVIGSEIDSDDYQEYSFNSDLIKNDLSDEVIDKYYNFFVQMGLKNLYENIIGNSTLDYVIGVLVGLDSNGRKNRGGQAFELACAPIIKSICDKYEINLIAQKEFSILIKYGLTISNDIKSRRFDFIAIKGNKIINIEVNFFNGGGSKPEEIIDSYINRQNDLEKAGIGFVLITDGDCWNDSSKSQLVKGFRHLKYLMNFNLAKNGMLEEVIKKEFGV